MDTLRYVALIGDIRGSRDLEDRAQVQERFERTLEDANETFDEAIAADLVITTGDEFQGLFTTPSAALEALVAVADELAPVRFVFGLGHGTLETKLKPQAVGMDGPCFHRARQALEAASQDQVFARVSGFGSSTDPWANTVLDLVGALRQRWTDRQQAFIRAYRELPTQRAVAERFEVSPSVVSESLTAASFHRVHDAETFLAQRLEEASR